MQKLITILFKVPELQRKILFTAAMLAVYRIGFYIPLPIVDQSKLQAWVEGNSQTGAGRLFGTVAMFGGTQVGMSTIFGLGIMPYISASIIFQLLASVIPSLEALQKEGESGRKKINEYTRYATVLLCLGQSIMWVNYMMGGMDVVPLQYRNFWNATVSVLIMTAGTLLLMWIGEQIDEYGIGNGISLLIMAGILARVPQALLALYQNSTSELVGDSGRLGLVSIVLLGLLFLGVVIGVIMMTESQRRIPTQSAKHVRGRRVYGGSRHYLPLKVNQAGVMPIIFASSLLMFPAIVFGWLENLTVGLRDQGPILGAIAGGISEFAAAMRAHGFVYNLLYIALIYFFCYFWTAITFNPKDMADNLKEYGSFIPGYRPGKRTAEYLEKVMLRITYVGAAFLSIVAVIPTIVQNRFGVDWTIASFLGGTGLLIVISVCIDLVQKIDSHLIMRNYPGLMSKK